MNKPKVSVVLVNYRGAEDTLNAIESLLDCDWDASKLEIIVVDNASGDDSLEKLGAVKNKIKLIVSENNLGFAGGVNLGVKEATGEIIALLNNDARADKNWITSAVEKLNSDKEIAAIACKVLNWDGSKIDFVDGSLTWYGMGYKREAEKPVNQVIDYERDVLFATGSAMFVKKSIFDEVGGFDENFFMFYEDVDLGWRLNLFGYKVKYLPTSIAYHKHHASIEKFGQYHEHYLLERNALLSLYKNYEAMSLDSVLPAAMALSVRRSLSRGDFDSELLELTNKNKDANDSVTANKEALTGTLAIDSFVSLLPKMQEARDFVQAKRRKTDAELLSLFREAMEPAYPWPRYLEGYQKIVDAFKIEQNFKKEKKRVLVVTGEPLSENLAGPAIRALEIAKALTGEFECLLATTKANDLKHPEVSTISTRHRSLRKLVTWADIIVFQGLLISENPWIADTEKILISDLYDPFHLEVLEQKRKSSISLRLRGSRDTTDALNRQLRRADFFICASERQRNFWLGQLAAEGRINPFTYDANNNLSRLIDVVPFGVSDKDLENQTDPIREIFPSIKKSDTIALWSGGVYDWLDPLTIVKAVAKLNKPNLKLVFMGLSHPNKEVPEMKMVNELNSLSNSLDLTNKNVFFIDNWVNYQERGKYLAAADFGVNAHLAHIETTFSFRTRILDHFWAGLATITTKGDALADLIESHSAGLVLDVADVDGWV
ncbi:MAG: glycosyltransferase, partial [Candidatus Nanopelagicales bacterium]